MDVTMFSSSVPNLGSDKVVPILEDKLIRLDISDNSNETVVFGVLGLLTAVAGLVMTALQLQRMRRRQKGPAMDVQELAY